MKSYFLFLFLVVFKIFATGSTFFVERSDVNEVKEKIFGNIISETRFSDDGDVKKKENLVINADSRIDTLIQIHKEEIQRKGGIEGYRVQIFQGNKESADQAKVKFLMQHENLKAYVLFQSPDFKVRVGDFRTRSEALKIKRLIENQFSSTFVVEDIISLPEVEPNYIEKVEME